MAYKLGKIGTDIVITYQMEDVVEAGEGWVKLIADKPDDGKKYIITSDGSWAEGTYVPAYPNTVVIDKLDVDTTYRETGIIVGKGWTASVNGLPFEITEDEVLYLINANGTNTGGTDRMHILASPSNGKLAYRFSNGETLGKFNSIIDETSLSDIYGIGDAGLRITKTETGISINFGDSDGSIDYNTADNTLNFDKFKSVSIDDVELGGSQGEVTPESLGVYTKEETDAAIVTKAGIPVGHIYWGLTLHKFSVELDGRELSRSVYKTLWEWVDETFGVTLRDDEYWQSEAAENGGYCRRFSSGDGSKTFRVPNISMVKGNESYSVLNKTDGDVPIVGGHWQIVAVGSITNDDEIDVLEVLQQTNDDTSQMIQTITTMVQGMQEQIIDVTPSVSVVYNDGSQIKPPTLNAGDNIRMDKEIDTMNYIPILELSFDDGETWGAVTNHVSGGKGCIIALHDGYIGIRAGKYSVIDPEMNTFGITQDVLSCKYRVRSIDSKAED